MPNALMILVTGALSALSCPAYFPDSREVLRAARVALADALWVGEPSAIRVAALEAMEAVESVSEREAEGAWLRYAESRGWEEALRDERREAGL